MSLKNAQGRRYRLVLRHCRNTNDPTHGMPIPYYDISWIDCEFCLRPYGPQAEEGEESCICKVRSCKCQG